MIKKEKKDVDCRALSSEFFNDFLPGEKYHVFIELVNKYHDELEICFRGNNQPSEAVCIYYNNHLVYKIEANGNITINFNHARYSTNFREYWKLINYTYGFDESAVEKPRIKVIEKRSESGKISYYTGIGYLTSTYNESIKMNVENIYLNCIRKMLIDSFDISCNTDIFRKTANTYTNYKSKLKQTGRKSLWIEKIRQQQLFSRMKFQKNGYFLYDLEFAQKSLADSDEYLNALSNEPDMLAIYFDDLGKPSRFAFVEIKSTDTAYSGTSGMVPHLQKMKDYPKSYLKARLKEAALILYQYKELGLYGIKQDIIIEDYLKIADKKPENLFVFTDKAVKKFHEDESCDEIKDFKKNAKQLQNIDIHIPGCKELEIWVI